MSSQRGYYPGDRPSSFSYPHTVSDESIKTLGQSQDSIEPEEENVPDPPQYNYLQVPQNNIQRQSVSGRRSVNGLKSQSQSVAQGGLFNYSRHARDEGGQAPHCSILLGVMLFILVEEAFRVLTLGLETFAKYSDYQWNKVVNGESAFPVLDEAHKYFNNKTIHMRKGADDALKEVMLRNSGISIAFLVIMIITIMGSVIHLVLVYGLSIITESSLITSGVYGAIGLLYLICASLEVGKVTDVYENNYRVASHILFHSNRSSSPGNQHKIVQLRMDEETLGYILTLCAYVSKFRVDLLWDTPSKLEDRGDHRPIIRLSTRSVHIYSYAEDYSEEYSQRNLDSLGFCDHADMRTAVYSLLCIAVVLCWLVPALNFMRGRCDDNILPPREEATRSRKSNRTVLLVSTGDSQENNLAPIHEPVFGATASARPSYHQQQFHGPMASSSNTNSAYTPNYPPAVQHFS